MINVIPITHIVRKLDTGKPMINGRRIPVDVLISTIRNQPNKSIEQIAEDFELSLGQVYAALSYYHDNKAEIEAIWQRGNERAADIGTTPSGLTQRIKSRQADNDDD